MTISKAARLIWTFYGNYSFASNLLNGALALAFYNSGPQGLAIIVAFKLASLSLIVALVHALRKNQYYYFSNVGLSWKWTWGITILLDLILFAAWLFLANLLR